MGKDVAGARTGLTGMVTIGIKGASFHFISGGISRRDSSKRKELVSI